MTTNLFRSPLFGNPADWKFVPASASVPRADAGQSDDWKEPRLTMVAASGDAVVELNWGPFWAALTQDVTGLTPGATYKISFTIASWMLHPQANAVPASDPLSVEARIKADASFGEWQTGAKLPYGVPIVVAASFTASAAAHSLGVDLRARHSLWQNKFIISSPVLELVSSPTPGGSPTNPPNEKLVRLNKKLITLAYAISNAEDEIAAARLLLQAIQADAGTLDD